MKKIIALAIAAVVAAGSLAAQENEVRRIPGVGHNASTQSISDYEQGVFIAAEASVGTTARFHKRNMQYGEADIVIGWRFVQYLKAGIGIGARNFFNNNDRIRRYDIRWDFPLYVNVRGNLLPEEYRNVVPYYSVDAGVAIRDGFLLRPTVGLRFGNARNAFLVGLSYVGQDYRSYECSEGSDGLPKVELKNRFVSGVALKLGYEF